jgi:hypothetical protein
MGRVKMIWLIVLVGLVVVAYMAIAADHAYIGGSKCQMCHKLPKGGEVWQVWEATAHAKAFESLNAEKGETEKPECLKCHTTGYGTGGYEPGQVELDLKNVQCEACHGAGADYKISHTKADTKEKAYTADGLMKPNMETCLTCHNEENPFNPAEPFDYDKMWAKITHSLPAKE